MAAQAPTSMSDSVRAKLDELTERRSEIERELASPQALADHQKVRELSMRKSALDPLVGRYERIQRIESDIEEMTQASVEDDAELAELAREELPALRDRLAELTQEILEQLVTADDSSVASVILELRAGVGGDEAGLWARDLLEMYRKRAAARGWSFEMMEIDGAVSGAGGGGVKSAVVNVRGEGVWTELAHEAGVHCVKRVPATESQGRIHTSTASVAALPEPEDIDVQIDPSDVDEHITTAQGPGGQNVNKVATAVHLLHRPSGVEVRMQEAKSQRQNREKAWRLLRARLYEMERERRAAERAEERSSQIGAGARSERIRTYRYKDAVAVDHRLNKSFNLQKVLAGEMDDLADALHQREVAERLARL